MFIDKNGIPVEALDFSWRNLLYVIADMVFFILRWGFALWFAYWIIMYTFADFYPHLYDLMCVTNPMLK